MPPLPLRLAALAFALIASASVLAGKDATEPAADTLSVRIDQMLADPQATDYAALWDSFLGEANLDDAMRAFDLIEAIPEFGDQLADICRQQAEPLQQALRLAVVSVRIHHVALTCAEALNDQTFAAREEAILLGLARHAFANGAGRHDWRPIRVLSEHDANTLIQLAGQQLYGGAYSFYSQNAFRHLPLLLESYDAEAGIEHRYWFDALDTWMQLNRADPDAVFFAYRRELAGSFLRDQAERGNEYAMVTMPEVALLEDEGTDAIQQTLPLLRDAVRSGVEHARIQFADLCLQSGQRDCLDEAIDLLLPLVEQHRASSLILLAVAYSTGSGVDLDPQAAEALLAKADLRLGRELAREQFAILLLRQDVESKLKGKSNKADIASALFKRNMGNTHARAILTAAESGSGAGMVLQASTIYANATATAEGDGLDWVRRAVAAGFGPALPSLARLVFDKEHPEESLDLLRRGAELGIAESEYWLALIYQGGLYGVEQDLARAQELLLHAAQGGDNSAGLSLSKSAEQRGDWNSAMRWAQGCAAVGDNDCAFRLANLFEVANADQATDGPVTARALYTAMSEGKHVAASLRLAAMVQEGRGGDRDPDAARATLLAPAEAGDSEAQWQLSLLLLNAAEDGGDDASADIEAGMQWLRRCAKARSPDCRNELGMYYLLGHNVERDLPKARKLLQQAASSGHATGQNNLAWFLCTTPSAEFRNPTLGLGWVRQAIAQGENSGYRDTEAACLAAAGDFRQAVKTQNRVLAEWKKLRKQGQDISDQTMQGGKERLKLYRQRRPYLLLLN
ncbi:MAG: hypothetical protein AB7V26_11300 [Lysobacterales bacterium]